MNKGNLEKENVGRKTQKMEPVLQASMLPITTGGAGTETKSVLIRTITTIKSYSLNL